MGFVENLSWRYATKEFDGRKVPPTKLEKILAAIRFSPSSFGIQPYRIEVIDNEKVKNEIYKHTFWDQKQIKTCSHVLVFCEDLNIEKRTADYAKLAEEMGRNDIAADPEFDYVKEVVKFSKRMGNSWATRQTYLALGFALAACAELKIDSCPMEAADFGFIKKFLNLPKKLNPVVLLPIGYRSPKDKRLKNPKIRFNNKDLFESK